MRGLGCPSRHTPAVWGHSLQKEMLQWAHTWSSGWWPGLEASFPGVVWDLHPGQESKCNGMRVSMGETCSCWWGHKEISRVSSHINYFMSLWEHLCFPGNFGAGVRNSFKLAKVSGLHEVGPKNWVGPSFVDTHMKRVWSHFYLLEPENQVCFASSYEYSLHVFKGSKAWVWGGEGGK